MALRLDFLSTAMTDVGIRAAGPGGKDPGKAPLRGPDDEATRRNNKRFLTIRPPRWGFFKGVAIGTVAAIPAFAVTSWLLARVGLGTPVPLARALRFTAIFGGAAAVLSAGGVGRLCAQASVDRGGGRLRAMWIGARTYALAGAGVILIVMIPHGGMPAEHWRWGLIAAAGAVTGSLVGMLLGAGCGGPAPMSLGDVFALARRPADALLGLLDSPPRRTEGPLPPDATPPPPRASARAPRSGSDDPAA